MEQIRTAHCDTCNADIEIRIQVAPGEDADYKAVHAFNAAHVHKSPNCPEGKIRETTSAHRSTDAAAGEP